MFYPRSLQSAPEEMFPVLEVASADFARSAAINRSWVTYTPLGPTFPSSGKIVLITLIGAGFLDTVNY